MEQRNIKHLIVDIDSIQAHPKNVRQGDIGAISESLKAHGQYRPIVVDERTGQILAGNHTWKAAKALGWSQIQASIIETKDEDEALRILLADNRSSDLASYDDADLANLLKELANTDEGLTGTAFDGDDLDDLLYKLEGSIGFVAEGQDINSIIGDFQNKDTRNLSLPYSMEQIETIKERLTHLEKTMQIDNWAKIVWQLVEDRHASS